MNELMTLLARACNVPSALVMRVHEREIEVFAASQTPGSPYQVGDKEHLDMGLYCESVMEGRMELLVPNALKDALWCNNPDIRLGMIAYFGCPLYWPDGRVFGTICVLDSKDNAFGESVRQIVRVGQRLMEDRLRLVAALEEKEKLHAELLATRNDLAKALKIAVEQVGAGVAADASGAEEDR